MKCDRQHVGFAVVAGEAQPSPPLGKDGGFAALHTGLTLAPGMRLAAYDILSLLVAGGIGEASSRARDTKLGREVAIKILPQALDTEPVARSGCELLDVGGFDERHRV